MAGYIDATHTFTVLAGDTIGLRMTASAEQHQHHHRGVVGEDGPSTGAPGPTGPQGVQGPSGPAGPAGPTGRARHGLGQHVEQQYFISINQVVQFGGSSYISLANLNQGDTPSPVQHQVGFGFCVRCNPGTRTTFFTSAAHMLDPQPTT